MRDHVIGVLSSRGPADSRSADVFLEVLPWLAALVVLLVLGVVAIYLLRRSLARSGRAPPEGFTLQQIRDLQHAQGTVL